jgi:hypothetical protein
MSDPTPTRQETVEANLEDVIARWGADATEKINTQCLQDINISLAILCDSSSSAS